MNVQSLSVVVPNNNCINNCKFCVSHMHSDDYKNQMDDNLPFFDLYLKDYLKRLDFAQRNGCNTVMLTGNSEPQQNRKFLTYFGLFMQLMKNPFDWIEMQTTGALLDNNYLRFLRNHVGVNIISLSVSSFDQFQNQEIIGCPVQINLEELCKNIKKYDFTLRLSLNLSYAFNDYSPEELFSTCYEEFLADQVTLRVLYSNSNDTPQSKWVSQHAMNSDKINEINSFIKTYGTVLGKLPYGATKYSYNDMSIVLDDDCMGKRNDNDAYKYLILRPDCKLYSSWDDKASLIF